MYSKIRKKYFAFGTAVERDKLYNSKLVSLFINMVSRSGKKSVAENIVYRAMNLLCGTVKDEDSNTSALRELESAVLWVAPKIEFKSSKSRRKKSRAVPIETHTYHSVKIAIKWIIDQARHSRKRAGKSGNTHFSFFLSSTIRDASKGHGPCVKKKKALYKRGRQSLRKPLRRRKEERASR